MHLLSRAGHPSAADDAPRPRPGPSWVRVSHGWVMGFLVLALSACGEGAATIEPPEEEPYLRGSVESLLHRATASSIVVRPGPDAADPCGIAATVDAETRYASRAASDRSLSPAVLADIEIGDSVEVYVSGPVAESCPVQGYAERIVLIQAPLP